MSIEHLSHEWREIHNSLPPIVTRKQIHEITGLISAGTLANYDVRGEGIPGKRMIGKRAAYPRLAVVEWLQAWERPSQGRRG